MTIKQLTYLAALEQEVNHFRMVAQLRERGSGPPCRDLPYAQKYITATDAAHSEFAAERQALQLEGKDIYDSDSQLSTPQPSTLL